ARRGHREDPVAAPGRIRAPRRGALGEATGQAGRGGDRGDATDARPGHRRRRDPQGRGLAADILRVVTAQRAILRLRVVPGAKRPGIVGRLGEAWKVRVVEPAEDGKANGAVLALLAQVLQVPRRDLEVTAGRASRDKLVVLAGLSSEA